MTIVLAVGLMALPACIWLGRSRGVQLWTAQGRLGRALAWGLVVLLILRGEIAPAGLLAAVLWHVRDHRALAWTYYGLMAVGVWMAARLVEGQAPLILRGWVVLAALESALVTTDWAQIHWSLHRSLIPTRPLGWSFAGGTVGHRTLLAVLLAMLWPSAWAWHWAWGLAILPGIILASSWLAYGATVVAMTWWAPWLAPCWLLPGLLVGWDAWSAYAPHGGQRRRTSFLERYTTRGDTFDTLRARWAVNRQLLGAMARGRVWFTGAGLGVTADHLLRWKPIQPPETPWIHGASHNDVLEWCYETGAIGWLALLAIAWQVVPTLRLGDPLSAGILAGALCALGTYPMRIPPVAVIWWALCAWGSA